MRTGESHANADRDRDGNSHSDSNTNGDSNGYAHTDGYAYCDSDSYAYTDSYAYCDSNGYAYADSYAYCDANFVTASNADGPAEVYSDAATAADAAAPSVGPDSEACLALVRRLPDEGGSSVWRGPERFRGCRAFRRAHAPRDFGTKVLWECDASSHRFQSRSKSRKRREDAHALRRSSSYRTKR